MTTALLLLLTLAATPAPAKPAAKVTPPAKPPAAASAPPATAAPPAAPNAPPADPNVGREVRTIPLNEKQAARVHIVRTSPGVPATIEFPEDFKGTPACGDCGEQGLFRLDAFSQGRYITIKPRRYPESDPPVPVNDFLTVVTVRLQTYTLTIQVEYAQDATRADPRVVFTLPERAAETAYVRAELDKARKALDEEYAARLEQGSLQRFLQALTAPHHCVLTDQRQRSDDLVVKVTELCYFGSAVYVRFTVDNRGRLPVDLADVVLRKGRRGSAAPVPDAQSYLPVTHLEFQSTVTGVVGAQLPDGEEPARAYELAVSERGGKSRTVVVSDLTF